MVRFLCPRLWRESHPSSLSMPFDGKRLRLSVKAVGDFSSTIPSVSPGTRVILEGPYGIFTSARTKAPKVLCLAFGIGITPIRAIAEDLGEQGRDVAERDVFLCGPPVVMRMLSRDLAALGVPPTRVFTERFSLQ